MERRIYVETTIPSFYYEQRKEPAMVARRELTKEWWAAARSRDEFVTSVRFSGDVELPTSGKSE